ncbi:hypothetical protein F5X97DRAFT_342899 [Nemania serpens]|nr:hypothetical protein F5X97DRAFT_342899 [Nemania serpens]
MSQDLEKLQDSELLLQDDKDISSLSPAHKSKPKRFGVLNVLSWALNIVLLSLLLARSSKLTDPTLAVYSPANSIIEYETVVMTDNVWNISPYQGHPDDAKDALWDELYGDAASTLLDETEARQLPNQTAEVAPGKYIVELEVFHLLHCVNSIRKTIYPERYPDYALYHPNGTRTSLDIRHIEHCIDRLRQTVQCASNVGTIIWVWRDFISQWDPDFTTTHTCRNYKKIRDWAVERAMVGDWDRTVRIPH